MTNDLISVIIPVYNADKYLIACLDSIKNQTYPNLEVLLIDDGSTDNSGKICDEYAEKDHRFKVFHKPNGGVSSARNFGLEKATGRWLSFVDSDDYLALNSYEVMLSYCSETPCDIIIFDYDVVYPDGTVEHTENMNNFEILNRDEAMLYNLHTNSFPVTRLSKLSLVNGKNPSQLQKIRFDENIARGEDSVFNSQVIDMANNIIVIPDKLYHYVQSEESACRGVFRPNQLTILKMDEFYQRFYAKKYPNLLNEWNVTFAELLIGIYFDMYIDKNDYKKEMKDFYDRIIYNIKKIPKITLSTKHKIKFILFKASPKLFCLLHKIRWNM
jgi:glycosyltransferase involved in cell wall biosynthesis